MVKLPSVEMHDAPLGYECAGLHAYEVVACSAGTARPGQLSALCDVVMGVDDGSLRPVWAVEATARNVVRCMVASVVVVGRVLYGCCR